MYCQGLVFIAERRSMARMRHIISNRSLVEGHVDCFRFLAIMYVAVMDICIMYFQFSDVKISKSMVSGLHVEFYKKLPNCFPESLYHFTFPLSMYE